MGYADSADCADCADVDFCGSSAGVATDFRSNARRGGPSSLSFFFFFLWLTMWKSSEYICIYVLYVSLCAFLRPVLVLIFNKSERIIMIVCVTSKCVAICSCSKQFDSKFQCNKSGLRWMFRNGPLRCRLTNGMPNIQMLLWLSWSLLRGT